MGLGVVGLEPDRRAVFGDGLVELALVRQGVAEVVVGLGVVRLEPDRRAVFGDGLVELALVSPGRCRGCCGLGVVGLEPDRRAEFGDGLVELALVSQGDAEVGVGDGVVGLEPDRLAARGHGGFERLAGFPRQPLCLERTAQAAQMPGVAGAQPLEIAEHGDGLVGIASGLEGMGQLVGRLGADRSRGGVEPDRLVAARQLLQHPRQRVVDPDIARMPLLGRPQHRLGPRAVAGIVQTGPQQVQADRAQLIELRRLCQCLQCGQPGRLVGLIQGGPQLVPPGVGVGDAGGFAQSCRPGGVCPPAPADRRPVVERRRPGPAPPTAGGPGSSPPPRRAAGSPDRSRPRGTRRRRRRRWPSRPGRRPRPADVDQAIEQRPVALGRVQPGLDLRAQGQQAVAGSRIADGVGLLDGGQRHLPPRQVLGLGEGLVAERDRLTDDPVDGRGPRLPLLEVIRRAQPAQGREGQHRRRQPELELAPPPFLDRPRHGHGTLPLGRLHPRLHARQVGRDPLRDQARVARPVLRLDRQAVLRQGDQLGLGPAAVQPGQGVGRVAPHRLAEDLRLSCVPV